MNLYRKGDYVAQFTFEWCVGASLQMALNMATDASRTSRKDQQRLWAMAQARSSSPFGGANPRGWTAALNDLGIGPYELVSIPTFEGALQVAARAIRETKRSNRVFLSSSCIHRSDRLRSRPATISLPVGHASRAACRGST